MIRKQPKAPQGINNRPNPETTNTISRLQKDVGVMFVNECACGGYWKIWIYDLHVCPFKFFPEFAQMTVCFSVSSCLLWSV